MTQNNANDGAPRPKVDTTTNGSSGTSSNTTTPVDDPATAQGQAAREAVRGAAQKATSWFAGLFPKHTNAAMFGTLGLVAAVLIFSIGLWRTLITAILVVAGVCFGQYLDGDAKLWRTIKSFFGKSN